MLGLTEEPLLLLLPPLERHRPERALSDHHVRPLHGNLSRYQMPIDLSRDVPRVEHLESRDLDHELSCAEDVAGVVRGETDPAWEMNRLMVVDGLDRGEGVEHVGFGEERVVIGV
jgi:hypothetical protein